MESKRNETEAQTRERKKHYERLIEMSYEDFYNEQELLIRLLKGIGLLLLTGVGTVLILSYFI